MKINKIYLAFCIAAIAMFLAGRCTKQTVIVNDTHTIDSLNRRIAQSAKIIELHTQNANKAFQKGLNSQKAKVVVRTIYVTQIAKNHALKPEKKDSVIKEMFHVPYSDSSRFTEPVANGVLDLGTEVKALKAEAKLDSVSLASKDEGIQELGQVINALTDEGSAKNGLIIEERELKRKAIKEARKQKRLKWIAIGGVFVIGTLAIIN